MKKDKFIDRVIMGIICFTIGTAVLFYGSLALGAFFRELLPNF